MNSTLATTWRVDLVGPERTWRVEEDAHWLPSCRSCGHGPQCPEFVSCLPAEDIATVPPSCSIFLPANFSQQKGNPGSLHCAQNKVQMPQLATSPFKPGPCLLSKAASKPLVLKYPMPCPLKGNLRGMESTLRGMAQRSRSNQAKAEG